MPIQLKAPRASRNRVDLSSDEKAKHWCKALGSTREELQLAVAKVGDNCETVRKELKRRMEKPAAV